MEPENSRPLFWKNEELTFNESAPFEADVLGREVYADNLTRLLESTRQPFVLGINAPWGAGKTTFLRMWSAKLKNQGHYTIYFNAWKIDFVEDPLVAMVGELQDAIDGSGLLQKSGGEAGKVVERLKTIGVGILRRTLPVIVRVGSAGLIDTAEATQVVAEFGKDLSEQAAEAAKERLDKYYAEKSAMEKFREELGNLVSEIEKLQPEKRLPLVVAVDELDRCKPDFAILLLERVKHLFSVPGIVFVLGLDATQLAASVRAVYGSNFGAEGYLRRFIDIEFNLPAPTGTDFAQHLYHRSSLASASQPHDLQMVAKVFGSIAKALQLTLRTQEQCFTQLNIVFKTTDQKSEDLHRFIVFLILAKASDRQWYESYRVGSMGGATIIDILRASNEGREFLNKRDGQLLEAYLYGLSRLAGDFDEYEKRLQMRISQEKERRPWGSDEASDLLEIAKRLRQRSELLDQLSNWIEFASRFRTT